MVDAKRWMVEVSAETDEVVRQFLGSEPVSPARLSSFIEEAVRWRILDQTIADARRGFDDLAPDALEALVDEAVTAGRTRNAS